MISQDPHRELDAVGDAVQKLGMRPAGPAVIIEDYIDDVTEAYHFMMPDHTTKSPPANSIIGRWEKVHLNSDTLSSVKSLNRHCSKQIQSERHAQLGCKESPLFRLAAAAEHCRRKMPAEKPSKRIAPK